MEILAVMVILFPLFIPIIRDIWSKFDHSSWDEKAQPSLNAKIADIKVEKVHYVKNGAKYKTTVLFSDGFRFVTHRTDRDERFFTYSISLNKEEILRCAMNAHKEAVEKRKQ